MSSQARKAIIATWPICWLPVLFLLVFPAVRPAMGNEGVEALFKRGLELQKADRIEEATALYDKCLSIDPKYQKAIFAKGIAFMTLADYGKAIDQFDAFLVQSPGNVNARLKRAFCRLNMGDVEQAKGEFIGILGERPNLVPALIGQGSAEYMLGQRFTGVYFLKKALELQPDNRSLKEKIDRLEEYNLDHLQAEEADKEWRLVNALNNAFAEASLSQQQRQESASIANPRERSRTLNRQMLQAGLFDEGYMPSPMPIPPALLKQSNQ
ncbi:MAG: hypothetical protein V2B18_14795 [Pseudomonadota bacterium]